MKELKDFGNPHIYLTTLVLNWQEFQTSWVRHQASTDQLLANQMDVECDMTDIVA